MKEGYIASETDIGAWMDAAKGIKTNGEWRVRIYCKNR
jgi:hypothetical protein